MWKEWDLFIKTFCTKDIPLQVKNLKFQDFIVFYYLDSF